MTDIDNMNNWNAQIIAEFRANGGEVASLGVIPIVILHSKGAKSGLERENPLVPLIDGDALYLFASKADGGVHTRRAHDWRTPCSTETWAEQASRSAHMRSARSCSPHRSATPTPRTRSGVGVGHVDALRARGAIVVGDLSELVSP